MKKQPYILALAMILGIMAMPASATVILSTGQTGAQAEVNASNPMTWNFGLTTAGADFFNAEGFSAEGLLDLKIHNKTSASVTLTLYSGLGGDVAGNTVVASVTLPASAFTTQYMDGSASPFLFSLPDSYLFTQGYYSLEVTTAATSVSTGYQIKTNVLTLENSDGTPLSSSYWVQDLSKGNATTTFNGTGLSTGEVLTVAPEVNPTWAMAIFGAVSFGGMLMRRARKPAHAAA